MSDEGRSFIIQRDVGDVVLGAGCPTPRSGCGGRDKYWGRLAVGIVFMQVLVAWVSWWGQVVVTVGVVVSQVLVMG